jgi:hypothetical protein
MSEQSFGDTPEPGARPALKAVWPLRPRNQIEWTLTTTMGEALACVEWRTPMIFIEEDDFANADQYAELYGEQITAFEADALRCAVYGEVAERYRRQIIAARECGERATMPAYLIACLAEGISPLLKMESQNVRHW